MTGALWVLCGLLLFTIIEKIFSSYAHADGSNTQSIHSDSTESLLPHEKSERSLESNDTQNELVAGRKPGNQPIKIAGYLNLMANSIDNFTQGLAVAASFLVSFRQGLLGTIAILCKFNFSRLEIA